jgi:hypothetical protein
VISRSACFGHFALTQLNIMEVPMRKLTWCATVTLSVVSSAPSAEPACNAETARKDPVAFVEAALARYRKEVQTGYDLTLDKTEVEDGKVQPEEVIQVHFRKDPRSVFFHWLEGAGRAQRVLYVEGENKNGDGQSMMLVQPSGFLLSRFIVARDPDGADARGSSRFPITGFGFDKTLERTLAGWKEGLKKGTLTIRYLGIERPEKLDKRPVHVFHGVNTQPGEDGVPDLTAYFDTETCLPTGMILRDQAGKLMGEYYFRDVKLNPDFTEDRFTRAALK